MRVNERHVLEVVSVLFGELLELPDDFLEAILFAEFFPELQDIYPALGTGAVGIQNLLDVDDAEDGLAELFKFSEAVGFGRLRRVVRQKEQRNIRIFGRLVGNFIVARAAERAGARHVENLKAVPGVSANVAGRTLGALAD